mmetsp:Transcript_32611/g.60935  ORF Transcript_32611/g.60935 Transcript_32611/m.60935 type:complete len:236 (-) Transcript_32611:1857-2564(-)
MVNTRPPRLYAAYLPTAAVIPCKARSNSRLACMRITCCRILKHSRASSLLWPAYISSSLTFFRYSASCNALRNDAPLPFLPRTERAFSKRSLSFSKTPLRSVKVTQSCSRLRRENLLLKCLKPLSTITPRIRVRPGVMVGLSWCDNSTPCSEECLFLLSRVLIAVATGPLQPASFSSSWLSSSSSTPSSCSSSDSSSLSENATSWPDTFINSLAVCMSTLFCTNPRVFLSRTRNI